MAVLCEAISVVTRTRSVQEKFVGGFRGFLDSIPNNTYCSDGELERVGFLNPEEAREFVAVLENSGLTFHANNECVDICVVDMLRGPTLKCSWIEFTKMAFGEGKVSVAWLFEGKRLPIDGVHMRGLSVDLHTPPGWEYDESLKFYPYPPSNSNIH
jgi:hypothetical protein